MTSEDQPADHSPDRDRSPDEDSETDVSDPPQQSAEEGLSDVEPATSVSFDGSTTTEPHDGLSVTPGASGDSGDDPDADPNRGVSFDATDDETVLPEDLPGNVDLEFEIDQPFLDGNVIELDGERYTEARSDPENDDQLLEEFDIDIDIDIDIDSEPASAIDDQAEATGAEDIESIDSNAETRADPRIDDGSSAGIRDTPDGSDTAGTGPVEPGPETNTDRRPDDVSRSVEDTQSDDSNVAVNEPIESDDGTTDHVEFGGVSDETETATGAQPGGGLDDTGGSVDTVGSFGSTTPATSNHDDTTAGGSSRLRAYLPAFTTVINVVGILVLLAVLAPFLVYSMPQLVGADEGFIVLSGSMEPSFEAGDMIIVESVDPESVSEGDVITFRREDSDTPVTHRVIDVDQSDGAATFKTKGDANEEADNGRVQAEQVVGRVMFSVPEVGHVISAAATTTGRLLFFVLPLGLLAILEIINFLGADPEEEGGPEEPFDPLAPSADLTSASSPSVENHQDEGYSVDPTDMQISLLATTVLAIYSAWITYRSFVRTGVPDSVSVSICVGAITALLLGVWTYVSASVVEDAPDRQDVVDIGGE
jgi:signal peptidase